MPEPIKMQRKKNCIICGSLIPNTGVILCTKCHKPCECSTTSRDEQRGAQILEVFSACCNADVRNLDPRITCSSYCHELYVFSLELEFGKYKRFVDATTGVTHKVPIRYVIEHGIRQEDLKRFPTWI